MSPRPRPAPILALILAAAFTLAPPLHGAVVRRLDLDALVGLAERVVVAEVARLAPVERDRRPMRLATLRVEQTVVGEDAPNLTVLLPGQDPGRLVPGAPRLATGEQVLVFLERAPRGELVIAGLGLGLFHLTTLADGRRRAERDGPGAALVGPTAPRTDAYRRLDPMSCLTLPLDRFLAEIRLAAARLGRT